MNRVKLIGLFLLLSHIGISQEHPFFKDYNWLEKPAFESPTNNEYGTQVLKHAVVTEFFYEGENLVEYFLEHVVLKLDTDEAIESYNKVYIPFSQSSEVDISKARVILGSGKINELDNSKIMTAEDDETGRKYKYFAFEGVEKGSIIEYFYVIKKQPEYNGKKITLQSANPKENATFELFSPKNLVFAFKTYNGLPEAVKDTTSEKKHHWKMYADKLAAIPEETFSTFDASRASIVYKLDENLATKRTGFATYSNFSKNLYSFYYPEYSKKTKEFLEKYLSKFDNKAGDSEAIIRAIENHLKTNVFITDINGEELENLEEILTKKIANKTGIIKLYIAILRSLNIEHELVFTSDRQELKFDKNFEAKNFLTDVLIYFTKHKTYLCPSNLDSRYGFPPAFLTDNYGLFIKQVTIGNFTSGVGKVKYIEARKAEDTLDQLDIVVEFDENDLTTTLIKFNRSISGYYAMYIQPYIHLASEKDKEELIDTFAKNINENVEITYKEMNNASPEFFGVKPLDVYIEFNSNTFVEKAGNKYLFKVGELIGQQIQMYQEKERVLPIESEFNRGYMRTISVIIPEGYKVMGVEDINIDNSHSKNNEELTSFKSSYQLENNVLKIRADEYYRENKMDVSLFEDFRKVINSAADFNKITLILEPIN